MSKYIVILILILITVSGAGCVTPEPGNNTTPPTPTQNKTVFTAEEVTEEQFNNTDFSEEGKFIYNNTEEEGIVKNSTIPVTYLKGKVSIESLPILVRTSDGLEEVEINSIKDNPNYPGSSQLNKIVEGDVLNTKKGQQPSLEEVNLTFENNNHDVIGTTDIFNVAGTSEFQKEISSEGDISYLRVEVKFYREFA